MKRGHEKPKSKNKERCRPGKNCPDRKMRNR
jgi:hypothetical protein